MSQSNEYPRVLYREPGDHQVWGRLVDLLEVADNVELSAALEAGWTKRADGLNDEPAAEPGTFSLLDETIPVIVEHLPALTKDELQALLLAEQSGKTRKGVIDAIEAAIAALADA